VLTDVSQTQRTVLAPMTEPGKRDIAIRKKKLFGYTNSKFNSIAR
jgi:hypothetical protein